MSQAPRPISTPSRTSRAERIGAPAAVARRHDVGMAGEAEMRRAAADAREQVFRRSEAQPLDGEAKPRQRRGQHVLRAGILGRHRGAADQRARQLQRIGIAQSRSSSLIEVLARVRSSTRLTITAQASDGPGLPSASGRPGRLPGTTTE